MSGEKQTFMVEGMTCGGCERNVQRAVGTVPGATSATVDRAAGTLTVTGAADPGEVRAAVEQAGFVVRT